MIAGHQLKSYHRFIQINVIDHLPVCTDAVFSYRRQLTVASAVAQHVNSKYFYQADLLNFFKSITDKFLCSLLIKNSALFPFEASEAYLKQIVLMVTDERVLAVGYSTSPRLSNACLYAFDIEFLQYCRSLNLVYTRYSDDFIVSGSDNAAVKMAAVKMREILHRFYGNVFVVNDFKTKFTKVGRKIKLLGLVILPNRTVAIDGRHKRYIEKRLYYFLTDALRFMQLMGGDMESATSKISGHLSYVNSVDPAYLSKLRRKYGDIVDGFLYRTMDSPGIINPRVRSGTAT